MWTYFSPAALDPYLFVFPSITLSASFKSSPCFSVYHTLHLLSRTTNIITATYSSHVHLLKITIYTSVEWFCCSGLYIYVWNASFFVCVCFSCMYRTLNNCCYCCCRCCCSVDMVLFIQCRFFVYNMCTRSFHSLILSAVCQCGSQLCVNFNIYTALTLKHRLGVLTLFHSSLGWFDAD